MQCLITLPCCELLCQAVKKRCCNIQSQTRVHSRSRGHYFCVFPSTQTSWACFEPDFLFVKDFGDTWLKKYIQISLYNLGCIPLVVHLRKLRHKEFYLTYAKLRTYQLKTPSKKKHFPCLNTVTPTLYQLLFFPDLFLSSPFSLITRNNFPGSDSNLECLYTLPCKEMSSWHGEPRYAIELA